MAKSLVDPGINFQAPLSAGARFQGVELDLIQLLGRVELKLQGVDSNWIQLLLLGQQSRTRGWSQIWASSSHLAGDEPKFQGMESDMT